MKIFENIFASRRAFIAYITAGHRGLTYTQEAALSLIDGGVDILEIGIPFSDPTADGPVIQAAMHYALQRGIILSDIFDTIYHVDAISQGANPIDLQKLAMCIDPR